MVSEPGLWSEGYRLDTESQRVTAEVPLGKASNPQLIPGCLTTCYWTADGNWNNTKAHEIKPSDCFTHKARCCTLDLNPTLQTQNKVSSANHFWFIFALDPKASFRLWMFMLIDTLPERTQVIIRIVIMIMKLFFYFILILKGETTIIWRTSLLVSVGKKGFLGLAGPHCFPY